MQLAIGHGASPSGAAAGPCARSPLSPAAVSVAACSPCAAARPPRTHRRHDGGRRVHALPPPGPSSSLQQPGFDPTRMGGNPRWWEELEDEEGPQAWDDLTPDEVEDRVEEASAFISVLEDLQPNYAGGYNAFAEVWERLCRVPPSARVRVGNELDPGSLRGLWRASMQRYVLPDARAAQLLGGFSVLADFPQQPGEVVTYEGWAERWERVAPDQKFRVDARLQSRYPRAKPWLTPNQGQVLATRRRFRLRFFLHPRSGAMHARMELPLLGGGLLPLMDPWTPLYCRLRPELTLTPLEADAGADMTLEFGPLGAARRQQREQMQQRQQTSAASSPSALADARGDARFGSGRGRPPGEEGPGEEEGQLWGEDGDGEGGQGEQLTAADLPDKGWPKPQPDGMWPPSPFSSTFSDFVRVVGPGMYVGCGYPLAAGGGGMPDKDACVHFLMARKA